MVEGISKGGKSDGTASTIYTDQVASDKHRYSLVWGGWERETRRQVVLSELSEVIDRVGARDLMDNLPWTTGPRRSVALANFCKRPHEQDHDIRKRMHQILLRFAESDTNVKGKRLWCSFSRSPEERRRAAHASLVKRIVAKITPGAEDRLDNGTHDGDDLVGSAQDLLSRLLRAGLQTREAVDRCHPLGPGAQG